MHFVEPSHLKTSNLVYLLSHREHSAIPQFVSIAFAFPLIVFGNLQSLRLGHVLVRGFLVFEILAKS